MYGTGMNPHMLNHYFRVARDMNNYVALSAYQYYRTSSYSRLRDQGNVLTEYQRPSLFSSGFGSLLAYGLYALRMPAPVVNIGYRLG
ncbi:hypothetical protein I4U23_007476 [Adineta vaga]|nr:hypothetical protein I4U23_007476 [Adineta vaga]